MASRLLDWFWLSSAERALRATSGEPSARALELTGRAALAAEAAARVERPAEPFLHGGAEAVAAELYRQAIHWTLLAHAELRSPGEVPSADQTIPALLERDDGGLLVKAAGGETELVALKPRLLESYREFAELEPSARRALVAEFARLSKELLDPLAGLQQELERIWVRRVVHLLGVVVVLMGLGLALRQLSLWREKQNDLAVRATWTTSSRYASGGCKSPQQRCEGGENYFFHTVTEANPWVMFDLGKERSFSAIQAENRLDCCIERAVPLVVEVGNDKSQWKEVARATEDFTSVRRGFPSVKARYVRLRVASPSSILHLSRVRIFP